MASWEEAPEEMIFLLRDAASVVLRDKRSKAGRRSDHPKKGRGTSELLRLRAKHERTQAELLREGKFGKARLSRAAAVESDA